ncbi:MAG: hypothetical protein Q8N26_20010 [Myxococcales bacterium]|nr:hypothetical protein [Myxococcales bacterium]
MTITNQPAALRGANLLLGYAIGSAFGWVVSVVLSRVFASSNFEALQAAEQLLWLGLSVVLAVGVILIATAVDRPALAWTLVAVVAIGSMFDLSFTLLRLFAKDSFHLWSLLSWPSMLLGLAERVVLLIFLVRLCGAAKPWALMVALVGGASAALRTMTSALFPFLMAQFGGMLSWYPSFGGVLGLIGLGSVLALVIGARTTIAQSVSGAGSPVVAAAVEPPASPAADFGIGGVLLALGVGVSVASYAAASSGAGGRYVVATGFIGVGLGRLIRGLIRLSKQ